MFKYLEHQADMGILAEGRSWPEVFSEGAKAVFNLMHDIKLSARGGSAFSGKTYQLGQVEKSKLKTIIITIFSDNIEGLFVEWLNELLAQESINNLIFIDFKVRQIKQREEKFALVGAAGGINKEDFLGELKIEVKAATYAGLKCGYKNKKYFCQCVVDV